MDSKDHKNEWSIKDFVQLILVTVFVVLPIRIFVAQPFIVSGESMDPTFHTGQYLIVDQITYRINEPKRGDVIIFRMPQEPSKFLIKRLIGLPGETVKIIDNDIYIKTISSEDFVKLDEDYVLFTKSINLEKTLSEEEYFLLGDNRSNSLDSRYFGPIEKRYIVGRALIRLFPFSKINWMPGKEII